MQSKGHDYVAAWPAQIARKFNLSTDYVAEAMDRAGLGDRNQLDVVFAEGEYAPEVAALTPETARQVMAELRAISDEIARIQKTTCRCCGLDLRNGECPQCGEPLA